MDENTVAAAEPIRFGHGSAGVRHPADAIHHKEIAIAPRRQQETERPYAVPVGASQRVRLRIPSIEGPHDTDLLGGRGLESEHHCEGALLISARQSGTTHKEADRKEDGHEASGASHGAEHYRPRPVCVSRSALRSAFASAVLVTGAFTDRDPWVFPLDFATSEPGGQSCRNAPVS